MILPRKALVPVGVLIGLLATGPAVEAKSSPPKVDWSNYSPTVKQRIKTLAKAKDCQTLQGEFDTAEMNNTAQRKRTGDGNVDLMAYIDFKMEGAGCYK